MEGKVHNIKYFWRVLLFFTFALVAFGCSRNRGAINAGNSFSVTGKGTQEGIVLRFNNIPENTVLLTVSIVDNTADVSINYNAIFWNIVYFSDFIREVNELGELRKTQTLLFPFTKEGHEYIITIYISTDINNLDDKIEYSIVILSSGGQFLPDNVVDFAGGIHMLVHENTEWNVFIGTPTPPPMILY